MLLIAFVVTNFIFALLLKIYLKLSCGICKCSKHLVGKTALVTGASRGIGFETAKNLAERGARVIITSSKIERGIQAKEEIVSQTGNNDIHVYLLDYNSLNSVKSFANKILNSENKLHILINNAGETVTENIKTVDGLVQGMQINYFAPFLLTNLLLPLLNKSAPSRIINVTSMAYRSAKLDLDDLNGERVKFNSTEIYKTAKLCMVLMTAEMGRQLKGTGVTVNCLHPGFTNTERIDKNVGGILVVIQRSILNFYLKTCWEGAQTTIYLAVSPEIECVNGQYFRDCQLIPIDSSDEEMAAARRLCDLSQHYVKLQ